MGGRGDGEVLSRVELLEYSGTERQSRARQRSGRVCVQAAGSSARRWAGEEYIWTDILQGTGCLCFSCVIVTLWDGPQECRGHPDVGLVLLVVLLLQPLQDFIKFWRGSVPGLVAQQLQLAAALRHSHAQSPACCVCLMLCLLPQGESVLQVSTQGAGHLDGLDMGLEYQPLLLGDLILQKQDLLLQGDPGAPGSSTAPVPSSARPVTTVTSSARPVTTRNNKPKAATRVGTHTAASPTAADETARQQQLAAHDTRIAAVCGASDPPTDPREGRQTTRAPTADERLVFSPVVVVQ
ncbi:hypothetical protein GWK47_005968 [Chionoecetes opilio]|uniref:Uncharacterized protein n=1 Tax=Chionoecetes opilio TaxID=41210 RepID=A0A8J4YGN5_CHIOP|nr:hypothetical protein GWK47_005968 [Chionoecetes opilio]